MKVVTACVECIRALYLSQACILYNYFDKQPKFIKKHKRHNPSTQEEFKRHTYLEGGKKIKKKNESLKYLNQRQMSSCKKS